MAARWRRNVEFFSLVACWFIACNDGGGTSPATQSPIADAAPAKSTKLATIEAALSTTCKLVTTSSDGSFTADCVNGCFIKWNPQMKEPYVTCASTMGKAWTPPCAHPHRKGDNDPAGGTCWGPPTSWCPELQQQLEVLACDGAGQCCRFPNSCTPCGWVACLSASDPACSAAANGDLTCPDELPKKIQECAICDGVVVCP